MASLALAFDIIARDKGASSTLNKVGDSADRTGGKLGKFGGAVKAGMAVAATAVAAGGVAAAVGMHKAVGAASDLGESVNAVRVTFGEAGDDILKLSENAAKAVGLSKTEFNGLAVQFSNFATTVAGEGGNVSGVMQDLTGRAADFASVMNLDVAEAARLFQSGLAGETEPLKRFGIDLSAAAVEAHAVEKGIASAGKEMTEQQKVQARYSLLMQATNKTAGDFANTSDSLANRQRILAATIDNLQARIGQAALPIVEKFFGFLGDVAVPAVEEITNILFEGDFKGTGPFQEDSYLVDLLFRLREGFQALAKWIRDDAVPAFQQFAGFVRAEVVPRLVSIGQFIATQVIPRLRELATWFRDQVLPAARRVADFLRQTFTPTFNALVTLFRDQVLPRIRELQAAIERNKPELIAVAKLVGGFLAALWALQARIVGTILPVIIRLAGFLIGTFYQNVVRVIDIIGSMVRTAQGIVDKFTTARDRLGEFITKMKDFKLPGWVQTLADLAGGISGGLKRGADRLSGLFGDAPGGFRGTVIGGGKTLARVQSILPRGLSVTSTYRSPAHNARIGGARNSLHMDRANPAVDIAGPVGLMDAFAARLASIGGWRQLLWRVAGHYDHIHVAHGGGVVSGSWPRMPGDRFDERTARLQVGETVVPRGGMPSELVIVDSNRQLIGRMRVEAGAVLGGRERAVRMYQ